MKKEWKNVTLGWKPEKGSLERKQEIFEDSRAKRIEEWKGNDRTTPEAFMRSSTPSKIDKSEPSIQESFPQISKSITVGLDACQIVIFRN